jgi:6-phosphofructokinase 2
MKSILTLTMNPAVDVSSSVENVFPEHKLRCGPVRNDPGGGGINVARVIRRLGGTVTAWHCSGGPGGLVLRDLLDREGVLHQSIEIEGQTRQNVSILETATGQQYRFVMPGPTLSEAEWTGALQRLSALEPWPNFIVASGSLPPGVPVDFYGRLADVVRAKGGYFVVDTSGAPLGAALERGVFLAKPSLRELRTLAGRELLHETEQEDAAAELVHSGKCEIVVVSLAAAGVLFASKEGCKRLPSPTVAVRSRVGAGDSMVAGIVFALAHGESLRESVRFGLAAGAAAVMNPGTELCRRDDVDRLYAGISRRRGGAAITDEA